jgi:TetR/AcrR family transcriptional repressor of nem operon
MIRREGLEATSVHKVMKRSGFTVGGFYAHFGSRQQMIRQAFIEAVKQRRDMVLGLLEGRDPVEWLPRFLESYLTAEHVDNRDGGCAWAALLSELPRADAATRRMAESLFDSSVRFYENAVREGAVAPAAPRRKGAAPVLSPRETALASLAMAFGHLNLARMVVNPQFRDEILATGLKASAALAAGGGENV